MKKRSFTGSIQNQRGQRLTPGKLPLPGALWPCLLLLGSMISVRKSSRKSQPHRFRRFGWVAIGKQLAAVRQHHWLRNSNAHVSGFKDTHTVPVSAAVQQHWAKNAYNSFPSLATRTSAGRIPFRTVLPCEIATHGSIVWQKAQLRVCFGENYA